MTVLYKDVQVPFSHGKRERKLEEKNKCEKINLNMREDEGRKKIISIVSFVHESIKNNVSYEYFYGFVDGVEDLWVIILPKN